MAFDKRKFDRRGPFGLDLTAVDDVTAAMDITGYSLLMLEIVLTSGIFGSAVVVLEISNDGVLFFETATTFPAAGIADGITTAARFARFKVKTADGTAGTVDGFLQAKS